MESLGSKYSFLPSSALARLMLWGGVIGLIGSAAVAAWRASNDPLSKQRIERAIGMM